MKKARTELMFYVLLASCILFIAASIFSYWVRKQYPIISHGPEKIEYKRKPLIRVGMMDGWWEHTIDTLSDTIFIDTIYVNSE